MKSEVREILRTVLERPTCNISDFVGNGIDPINPWDLGTP